MFWTACDENSDVRCSLVFVIAQAREYLLGPLIFNALALIKGVEYDENIARAVEFGVEDIQRGSDESLELFESPCIFDVW